MLEKVSEPMTTSAEPQIYYDHLLYMIMYIYRKKVGYKSNSRLIYPLINSIFLCLDSFFC